VKAAIKAGIDFQKEVKEKLEGQGFKDVMITKASHDYGGDILAFKDGLDYVVQCKKYAGTVGYDAVKDIATAMDIYQADSGILICDTRFSRNAHKAVDQIEKPIQLIGLEQLKTWKVSKPLKVRYRPFGFQAKILSQLTEHRKRGNASALLVLATGLGKTLIGAWDLKSQIRKKEKALFLVHRKDILVENAEKFHAILNEERENFKFGIYFEGKKFEDEKEIIFSTFQTMLKHYNDKPKDYFDYIIIDEAHHSPARTYSKILQHFKPKFILGVTATPRGSAKSDNEFIENRFGAPLVDLDLAEALVRGYTPPVRYSVFCDNIDYEKLESANKKLSIEQLNRTYFIPTKDEDIERRIDIETKKIKNPKTIIFCPSIKYANSVKSIGLFHDAEVYHSNMDDFKRRLIFRRFKVGKLKTILVVDLFNEGIDIPDANLVVFLRTTYSPTIFFQQLGRGLRKAKGKAYLRVLDFVGALSNIKKVIDVFGHLLIIKDFVEKVEKQKKLSNLYLGKKYKDIGLLEPLELDFYQPETKVKHREVAYTQKDFQTAMNFFKGHLIKSEGWTEEEVIEALRPICEKLGYFPSENYLRDIGRSDLDVQIARLGGRYYFARKLGCKVKTRPKGDLDDWERFENELLPHCKNGEMPTSDDLRDIGRNDLGNAISNKWGGYPAVAKRLGLPLKRRPKGDLDDWEIFKKELLFLSKDGEMPTQPYLRGKGRNDLNNAINRKFGGIHAVAKKLGLRVKKRPNGFWDVKKNLMNELQPIWEDCDGMPTKPYLEGIGRSDLSNAIRKWGGVPKEEQIFKNTFKSSAKKGEKAK